LKEKRVGEREREKKSVGLMGVHGWKSESGE